jgi:hypothetical protein
MPELPKVGGTRDAAAGSEAAERVQCPNCCRMAIVIRRAEGLLFYECELCLTVGATPESPAARE